MGPRIRAIAEADWLTPRISPCFSGSLRRDTRAVADGVSSAKPTTATVRVASTKASIPPKPIKWALARAFTPARLATPTPIRTMPTAMNVGSDTRWASRR